MPFHDASDVYFAQSQPGAPIKIGHSRNGSIRVREMCRCPLTGERMHMLAYVELPDRKRAREYERALHRYFSASALSIKADGSQPKVFDSRGRRLRGGTREWFRPEPELIALINLIRGLHDEPPVTADVQAAHRFPHGGHNAA